MPISEIQWPEVRDVGDVRMGKQLSPASRDAAGQFPYLRVANVHLGRINYADVNTMGFTGKERKTYGLMPGDILLNEGQSLELVGRSAIYDRSEGSSVFRTLWSDSGRGLKFFPRMPKPSSSAGWRQASSLRLPSRRRVSRTWG